MPLNLPNEDDENNSSNPGSVANSPTDSLPSTPSTTYANSIETSIPGTPVFPESPRDAFASGFSTPNQVYNNMNLTSPEQVGINPLFGDQAISQRLSQGNAPQGSPVTQTARQTYVYFPHRAATPLFSARTNWSNADASSQTSFSTPTSIVPGRRNAPGAPLHRRRSRDPINRSSRDPRRNLFSEVTSDNPLFGLGSVASLFNTGFRISIHNDSENNNQTPPSNLIRPESSLFAINPNSNPGTPNSNLRNNNPDNRTPLFEEDWVTKFRRSSRQ